MAWLAKVLGRGESREVEEIVQSAAPSKPSQPPLLLLVSDASGMAALRMLAFEEAQEACDYIEFWYPNRSAGTVYAIWALPDEPHGDWADDAAERGEAVILVRDEHREDVVYPFSFADLDSACAFLRNEMEKDLDLERVMIYWAVPIDIEMDSAGKIHVSPDTPPASALNEVEAGNAAVVEAITEADEPEVVDVAAEIAVVEGEEEADEAEAPVIAVEEALEIEAVAEEAIETLDVERPRTRFVYHDGPAEDDEVDVMEEAERLFEDDADDVPADIGLAEDETDADEDAATSEPAEAVEDGHDERAEDDVLIVEEVEPIEALPELVVEKFGTPFHDREFVETPDNGDVAKKSGNGHSKPSLEEVLVDGDEIKIDEIQANAASKNGRKSTDDAEARADDEPHVTDEKTTTSLNGHATANGDGHAATNSNGHVAANGNGRRFPRLQRNLSDEVTRILDGRRLDRQDGPFKGFNSPRGRF